MNLLLQKLVKPKLVPDKFFDKKDRYLDLDLHTFKPDLSPKLKPKKSEELDPIFITKQHIKNRGDRIVLITEIYKITKNGLELVACYENVADEKEEKNNSKNLITKSPKPTLNRDETKDEQIKRLQQEEAAKKKKIEEQKNTELKNQLLDAANKKYALSQESILKEISAKKAISQKQLQQEKSTNEKFDDAQQNLLKQNLEPKTALTTKTMQLQEANNKQAIISRLVFAFFYAHQSPLKLPTPKPTQLSYLGKSVVIDKTIEKTEKSSCKFFEQRKNTETPEKKLLRQARQPSPFKHKAEQILSKLSGEKKFSKKSCFV